MNWSDLISGAKPPLESNLAIVTGNPGFAGTDALMRLANRAHKLPLLAILPADAGEAIRGSRRTGCRERYFNRYTTVVSVSAGSGVGSP